MTDRRMLTTDVSLPTRSEPLPARPVMPRGALLPRCGRCNSRYTGRRPSHARAAEGLIFGTELPQGGDVRLDITAGLLGVSVVAVSVEDH